MTVFSTGLKTLPILLLTAACAAVGPNPEGTAPPAVPTGFVGGDGTPVATVAQTKFWADYRDTTLSNIIERGLAQNLNVLAANQRIQVASAAAQATGVAASQVQGSLTGQRERSGGDNIQASTSNGGALSASFVFDMFGGQQRARQAASASLLSAEAGAQTTRLAWIAEVISAYSDARYYQESMALTRNLVATRQQTVSVTRNKLDLGSATDFEVAQAEALLATARADLPTQEAAFNAQVFRLATLLNEPAGPLMAQLQRGASMLRVPAPPRIGVPADLLRNRPDVRAAEHDLVAAMATVGVAQAALYPSLSLTGSATSTGGSDMWSFGPRISLPLLNQGLLRATHNQRVAQAELAETTWRSSITTAVGDVQTQNSNLQRYRQQVGALEAAVTSYERAYELAQRNFEAGSLGLLDLLEVDRALAAARISLASARNTAAKSWASLNIAVGAGAAPQ
ncbi:Nodulation protein T (plasmid) [Ketogulonicigenium robustum]|uniref:Nodulation protein T n=1 Tax=Ketogulonicigenium robustum TaxID=92947 RepID=A0A1W6P359_9RHOB|nr:efflux transporter outer membrane subunit [Ketogulonicigenium robustum]ARO15869.1 Nodulation protein T [Ketogulonicigenium robustum]